MTMHLIRDGVVHTLIERPDKYWVDEEGNVYASRESGFDLVGPVKYIVLNKKIIKLIYNELGLYEDEEGTCWAIRDTLASVDKIDRCGVGPFSLDDPELTGVCTPHDYMYSSLAYQYFHTRLEADIYLKNQLEKASSWRKYLSKPFYYLSRVFGYRYWENKNTK